MKSGTALALLAVLWCGCRTAHDVAEDSYRVATAPVNVVREQPPQTAPVVPPTSPTSPTAPSSAAASQPAPRSVQASQQRAANEQSKPPVPASARPSSTLEFPTAKPVEGKPGYVYSPFDAGKYVDVSGYAPGSKVKDPYSGKIFLVP
ncbi:MAG TPA: hypothetical protein VJ719_08340 [Chthoniobacterales bacterium]|nr:hypothetical protein [Chthoniobacterales bacterium]